MRWWFRKAGPLATLAMAAMLLHAGAAGAAENFVFDDVAFEGSGWRLRIPRIEVTGSGASRADVLAIIDGKSAIPLPQRLQKLTAASVSVPELELTLVLDKLEQKTVYRGIRLDRVTSGRIAETTMTAMSSRMEQVASLPESERRRLGEQQVTMTMGGGRIADIDLVLGARLLTETGSGTEPKQVLHGDYRFDRMEMTIGRSGRVTGEGYSGGALWARPPTVPLLALIDLQGLSETRDPKDAGKILEFIAAVYDAVDYGTVEIGPVTMTVEDPSTKQPTTARIDSMRMSGPDGSFSLGNLEVRTADGVVRLGSFGVKGFSYGALIRGAAKALENPAEPDFRAMIPQLERIGLTGMEVDLPDGSTKTQRVQAKLGAFEIALGSYVEGIPSDVHLTIGNATLAVPRDSRDSTMRDLRALGYEALDLSAGLKLVWDEGARALVLRDLSTTGIGMGTIRVNGTIGNVTRDLFSPDTARATVAALAAQVKSLDLRIENAGLAEKLIAQEARKRRKKPEDVRAEYGALVALGVPAIFGDNPAGKVVANAMARFLAAQKSLSLSLKARGDGLSAADFVAVSNPQDLLGKVDVTASAD